MDVRAADLGPTGGPSLDARGDLCCAFVVVDFDQRFDAIGHVFKRHTVLDVQHMHAIRELHQNANDHEYVHAGSLVLFIFTNPDKLPEAGGVAG